MAKFLAVLKIVVAVLHVTHGCQMEGVGLWAVPVTTDILDVFSGTVMSRSTSSIEGIQTVTYGEGTIGGPYLEVSHSNSQFVMSTRAEYEGYEEIEVSSSMSLTVTFSCTGGTTATLIFLISVIDTNNNAPQFIPSNNFEFVVAPPLPPGFLVTGCLSYISVRDIDLTTQRIDFTIEENPYFEIEYDSASSTVAKEFNAVLRTTTFLRSLTEPITLRISATDVDLTGDEPLTTSATVTILADSQFQLPEEPVFSQPYYVVNYSDHQLVQLESIHLQQGFDEHVNFTLEGEYEENFSLTITDNEVTIVVTNPLPNEVVATNQIYLILRANRENTSGGSATIIVQFPEESSLSFESSFYVGAIENNVLSLPALILIDGYENTTVTATVDGEYSSYFSASVVENVVSITMRPLTDDIIESNSFISLEVVASSPSNEAITIVSLELIKDDTLTPVFEKSIYSGTYDPETGLAIEQIVLTQGADDTVNIGIFGVHEEYFQITRIGANVIVSATSLPAEIFAEQHVVLSIEADKPRTVGANAALIIALPAAKELIFQETFYKGTVQDNVLTLGDIRLDVDYDETVNFTLTGEHSEYFNITNTEGVVTVSLGSTLPETVITQNTVILLTVTASGLNAVSTTATILIDILKEDNSTPIFSRNIYYGTYLGASNVEIESISLSQGHDDGVSFRLDGEHSQYFGITYSDNVVTISLDSAPPEDLILNEKVLVFNVLADKALTVGANAAIVIGFPTELTEPADMRFAQNTYLGSLEGDVFSLGDITLDSGYIEGTSFHLSGEHYQHFQLSASNNVVQITYLNTLPIEDVTNNDFIVLDVEARRERAISTWTSVVVHLVKNENLTTEVPVFSQAYYRGSYDIESELQMNDVISLSNGFDDAVTFELEGDQSQWFALSHDNNVITLELNGTIPVSVVENNNQLLFTVIANNGDSFGRAAILIELPKDCVTKSPQFVQQYYKGYIENEILSMAPIYLDNSSITEFNYTLVGEFSDLFQVEYGQGTVELTLRDPVTDVIDADLIVMVLEIESEHTKAHTVLIVEIVKESNEDGDYLAFDEVFYTGSYTEGNPLQFTTPVSLATGYDSSVEFALEGDSAQWFGLVRSNNSVIVTLASPIPSGVLANNHHLIFVITALGNNTNTARATVVISLTDEYTEGLYLAFERVSYLISIGNDETNIPEIVLSEGYDQNVAFTLHGTLSSYFSLSSEGPTVTISLSDGIPEVDLPTNGIIVLEIQASAPPALTAYTTLIIEIVRNDSSVAVDIVFAQPYYTGSYTEGNPLQFTTPVSLATGYDSSVEFALEGDSAQWFGLDRNDNSVIVTLASPIPSGVLANNHHLIFVITAQGNNTNTARATVVISLTDEYTEGLYLAFERVSYLGSIGNYETNIPEIVLSEGYDQNVAFTLHGDLSSYFSLSSEGPTVTISLSDGIPEDDLPTNGIIVLEIQASAPPALTAYTTLIIEIVRNDSSVAVDLVFAQPYYTGSYTEGNPLQFTTPVSLATGYDSSVEFALEGDSAQWFGLVRSDNSVIVTLAGPIPSGVLANNHHLIFVITAQGNNTNTARATVVISLTDEYTEGLYLAFERVSYLGSIGNDETNIPEIVLSEGYDQNMAFTLHGDLSSYFSLSSEGPTVTIYLSDAIPEDDLPTNGIIVLTIQASAPPALTAYTTLIIEIVRNDSSIAVDIVFAQPYYTGSYTEGNPLQFTTPVSLATGYDSTIEFDLEGDSAQWFGLVRNDNSVIVTLAGPIPSGVLANNHNLIFVITAQGNNTNTARATVVISLTDEYTEGLYLAFERVSYLGSIGNDETNIPEIVLSEGYDQNVAFTLHGGLSSYFSLSSEGPIVTVSLSNAIPEDDLPANGIIVLDIQASAAPALTAYATLVIEIIRGDQVESDVTFGKVLYEGILENDIVYHETITVNGFSGTTIEVLGEFSSLFEAFLSNGEVTVRLISTWLSDQTHVPLELRAGSAGAVLLLNVRTEGSGTAVVTFSSPSYAIRVEISQTGAIGQVQAIADNGEPVTYSLHLDNSHLEERLSINSVGEILLAAPVNSGFYSFGVVATTAFTQISGTAAVYLSVEAVTVCGDELVMAPLIILDRDEEEPHRDLINGTEYEGCRFIMTNRWPLDQNWVYADETGVHTTAIDREHESIAFMALSQVQVEVTLQCAGDTTRVKRSLNSDTLGPYDYGTNKWVLTDTILFNPRRTLLNLIVNDINDNAPIFDGKATEPIAVGCPNAELQAAVMPRSLAELHATDADIGENAALVYWSSDPELSVSPTTGFVHIREGSALEQDSRLTVYATDQNGQGLTGSLELIVKLLDDSNIAVVTVTDAFLDDETTVLSYLKDAVGYDVKVLRSAIVAPDTNQTRIKRDIASNSGVSLQLYIYGLVDREPVTASRLIEDISTSAVTTVTIGSSVSLEDHLANQEICVISERDTGLLVATIVLSVLLFVIIVMIAVWYFLKWRRNKNYDQFSDENSLASRSDSVADVPKPEVERPRLNIEELKRSERRLQEMLNAPVPSVTIERDIPKPAPIPPSIIDIPIPETNAPIVIQSFDKLKDADDDSTDDEFGEIKTPRRKSVVTFNENVEKIIRFEDNVDEDDSSSNPEIEIYKL